MEVNQAELSSDASATVAAAVDRVRRRAGPIYAAMERMGQAMIVTDPNLPDNPVVLANKAFLDLTGYRLEEVVGRNCRFLQGEQTSSETIARLREAVSNRREITETLRNQRKDGSQFWNQLFIAPVFDEEGALIYFFAAQSDMSLAREAVETRAALRGSEARLNQTRGQLKTTLAAAGVAGTWDWDIKADRLLVDERFAQLTGLEDRAATTGLTTEAFFTGIHPLDRTRIRIAVGGILNGAEVFDKEYRLRTANGSLRWVHARGRCTYGTNDEPLRFGGVLLDITEQKRVEERLRIAQTAGQVGAFEYVPGFATVTASRQFCLLLGMTPGSSMAVNAINALVVSHGDILIDREPGSVGELPYVDVQIQRADTGEIRWIARRGEAIRDADTADVRHVGVIYDVTAAKRGEAELRELNETLEARVAAAVAERESAEEQLRQAQKMEAVGQLTGGLAHDFNNLLTGISGSLEMLQNRIAQGRYADVDRYVSAAQGASRRAAALTHRLLAFSRRQTLDPKPTNVNALVVGMEELIRRTVGPAIHVEVVGAGGLWTALVDPPQLENALLNLCINARDAMPDGGRITIETANKWLDEQGARERDLSPGQYLSLCVTDTGTGMPPDVVARVFEPFFTTKPIGQGTGLGLSMIYGFARQSGGQVRIYSEIGNGTTMCLYLPRHYGETDEICSSEGREAMSRSDRGETVLVVDDEPTVRMLVTDILEELGYTAIEAADSASGLKVLQSDVRIDLLVTDVGLPGGMNGRQMADAARVPRPGLKVLFITGYAENSVLGNGHLAPGMAVLTKPFAVETMAARIREMIEGST